MRAGGGLCGRELVPGAREGSGTRMRRGRSKPCVLVFALFSLAAGDTGVAALTAKIFTIFEGTSEIQRMLIGRTVTGLDVR
jgi:alkylation response protein AidB-like acyl-CoA dehydrogenase